MILKRGFLMFLTKKHYETMIFLAKTTSSNSLFVNDGNDNKHRSHVRSHDNMLNNKIILRQCERVNNFSCAHVRNYFNTLYITLTNNRTFFCFFLSRARVFLCSLVHINNEIKIKTNAYHVNDLKKLIHTSFTSFTSFTWFGLGG